MADAFESLVAENRRLRGEAKELRGRLAAFESSRWWRLHPRFAFRRLWPRGASADQSEDAGTEAGLPSKLARAARQWRLKAQHEQRNAGCDPDEIVLRDGIRLRLHPESRHAFEEFCHNSSEMVDEMDAFIAHTADKQRLLDIGALHGLFSLVFSARDPTKEALAVEASPIAFAKLLYNIHKNHAKNITPLECALSSDSGMLEMHYYWEHAVAGRVDDDGASLRVVSQTGDSLCGARAFAPDVIKVDVEGHEVKVLQGLRETIARNKPSIFLELHPAMISRDGGNGRVADLVSELVALGYRTAELRGRVVSIEELTELREIERLLLRPERAGFLD